MKLIEKKTISRKEPLPKIYFYIATAFVIYGLIQVIFDFLAKDPQIPVSKLLFRIFILLILEFYVFYRSYLGYNH